MKFFEFYISILLENLFSVLSLTAEAWLAHHFSAAAAIFVGTVEFHMEFYERLPVVEKCLEKCLIDQNENYIRHAPYIWNSIADDHGTPE